MASKSKRNYLSEYIRVHWPFFLVMYAALVAALLLIGIGLIVDWYALIPLALATAMVAGYFLLSFLRIGHRLYNIDNRRPVDILIQMSEFQPDERIACIDFGLRETAIAIASRLTIGEVFVIDVFDPQSNPSPTLRRRRQLAKERPKADPRLNWIDGTINLLPLPNSSVSAVYLNEILSEYWLEAERERLLSEIWRILIPEGRLLVAERVKTQPSIFLYAFLTSAWPTTKYWRNLITAANFSIRQEETHRGLLYCQRAVKPSPAAAKQMALNLNYTSG